MNIIITGNIGTGKSTVAKQMAKYFPFHKLESVDEMVHEMYFDKNFRSFLRHRFGTTVRSEVSDIVFASQSKRQELEKASMEYLNERISAALSKDNVILEFPLFYEMTGNVRYAGMYGRVVAVTCSQETQIKRVKARDNFSDEKINRIMASQHSNELKAAMSDHVIVNEFDNLIALDSNVRHVALALKCQILEERAHSFFPAANIWDLIKHAYTEPHRHYHTLEHLAFMFDQFDQHKKNIKHQFEVELAIWFHDFVYNTDMPDYGSNERNSVKAMFDHLTHYADDWFGISKLDDDGISVMNRMILAAEFILSTKGHVVKAPSVMADDQARNSNEYFLDIDLGILGTDTSTCDVFDDKIRKEFIQHSEDDFKRGRIQAMNEFEKRPQVFLTNYFHDKYELQARENLKDIIHKWS